MYNLMVGLFDHKIRTQSHFVILTVWVNFSQHLRPRIPSQTTFGPRRPGSTRSQVWGLLQQMCPSSAICPVKVSLSRRPEPYLCALSKRFGPKYQPNVVKRYWLDSSCSLLLSSRPVWFFFYQATDKVGRKHWADVSAGFLTGFSFFICVFGFLAENSQEADRALTWLACPSGATNHPIESWKGQPVFSPQKKQQNKTKLHRAGEKTPVRIVPCCQQNKAVNRLGESSRTQGSLGLNHKRPEENNVLGWHW